MTAALVLVGCSYGVQEIRFDCLEDLSLQAAVHADASGWLPRAREM